MPAIFSSKRTLRVNLVIRGLQPSPSSPSRLAPSSVARICFRNSSPSSADASTTLPLAEDEPRADDVVAEVHGRELRVGDHALGRVLDRAVEDLAVGHVAEAGRDDALAAVDPERQVGVRADDVHRAPAVEALLDLAHPLLLGVPVEQAGVVDELLVLRQRHRRPPRRRPRSGTRRAPSGRRARARGGWRARRPAAAASAAPDRAASRRRRPPARGSSAGRPRSRPGSSRSPAARRAARAAPRAPSRGRRGSAPGPS